MLTKACVVITNILQSAADLLVLIWLWGASELSRVSEGSRVGGFTGLAVAK